MFKIGGRGSPGGVVPGDQENHNSSSSDRFSCDDSEYESDNFPELIVALIVVPSGKRYL